MTIEDLKNTKIYLHHQNERVKFKNKVEKLGIEWLFMGGWDPTIHDAPFIYITEDLKLNMSFREKFESFCFSRSKQIFLADVLSIEEPKEECKFKPFDRVLVRDRDDQRWLPREFAWYNPSSNDDYPFETISGAVYRCCIPYDEDLVNTTKNK